MIEIPITKGQTAIIDDEDYGKISPFQWCCHGDGYAARGYHENGKVVILKMHHAVFGKPPAGYVIDHINGNKLDNRKCNLRLVTQQQNCFNSKKRIAPVSGKKPSRFKGVGWRENRKKWRSRITFNGKRYYLGQYETEEEAALAYNKAAKSFFGEYAKLNEI